MADIFSAVIPGPNFITQKHIVDSDLNLHNWEKYRDIVDPLDSSLIDSLKFGFCMGIDRDSVISIPYTNHKTAIQEFSVIDDFIIKHHANGAISGPYATNPLPVKVHPSPLQVATSASGKKRAVIDMSYPHGSSVNDAIPKDWNLIPGFTGEFKMPTHEDLCREIVSLKDPVMFVADMAA